MRKNISSGYDFEREYGYSRAVRVRDMVFVSGTTARGDALEKDAEAQAESILGIISEALNEAGANLKDVVRTVIYVRSMDDVGKIAIAHAAAFHDIRPASTVVEISKLTPETALVEIEATAVICEPQQSA